MRTGLLTAVLTLPPVTAPAQIAAFPSVGGDPLTNHIMRGRAQGSDVITGSARDASGQATPFKIVDPLTASLASAPLRDAVADTKSLNGLKPASGLAVKA